MIHTIPWICFSILGYTSEITAGGLLLDYTGLSTEYSPVRETPGGLAGCHPIVQ